MIIDRVNIWVNNLIRKYHFLGNEELFFSDWSHYHNQKNSNFSSLLKWRPQEGWVVYDQPVHMTFDIVNHETPYLIIINNMDFQ